MDCMSVGICACISIHHHMDTGLTQLHYLIIKSEPHEAIDYPMAAWSCTQYFPIIVCVLLLYVVTMYS